MDAVTSRLIENGFAFIAFLVVVIAFVWQVIKILDRRMNDIVVEIRALVTQQRGDSDRIVDTVNHHDARCEKRHEKVLECLNMSYALAEQHPARKERADKAQKVNDGMA